MVGEEEEEGVVVDELGEVGQEDTAEEGQAIQEEGQAIQEEKSPR